MTGRIPILLCLYLSLSACATADVSSYVVPGETLEEPGSWFIVFAENDERALHEMLRQGMVSRGLTASTGFADRVPEGTTYLVEYGSQWQWDVTWYLLNLSVRVYEPETRLLIASAHSVRTSLARKSSEEVVAETLDQLLGKTRGSEQ